MRYAAILGGVLLPLTAAAEIVVQPMVGADFEHFGETYHLTDDRDTVTVINDYGTLAGLTVRSPIRSASRFRLDTDVHIGKETRRLRLDFEGRLERDVGILELEQDATWRAFQDGGDYAISSDHLATHTRLSWERSLTERVTMRLQNRVDGTWYEAQDRYNLNQWTIEPRAEARLRFHDFDEAYVRGRFARKSVPDSSSLGYRRFGLDTGASLLFGWTSALDVSNQLERRVYDTSSVRESSWDNRFDGRFEFEVGERATLRLVHENEIIRYDRPDELDFDSEWARTGFEVEIHRTESLDLSIMPVYAFLQSATSPVEEYTETGLEVGLDLRIGTHTWISVTDEVGRRDYEISAEPQELPLDDSDPDAVLAGLVGLDTTFSDYLYNRLTILVSAELLHRVSANLFVNWQPEDHHLNRHDTDTRIVSGGFEYTF